MYRGPTARLLVLHNMGEEPVDGALPLGTGNATELLGGARFAVVGVLRRLFTAHSTNC